MQRILASHAASTRAAYRRTHEGEDGPVKQEVAAGAVSAHSMAGQFAEAQTNQVYSSQRRHSDPLESCHEARESRLICLMEDMQHQILLEKT
jgi:hypothetical protein